MNIYNRQPKFILKTQSEIYAAGLEQIGRAENRYLEDLAKLNLTKRSKGICRARLFGALFPLHAYASLGPEHLKPANDVFFWFIRAARRGCHFMRGDWRRESEVFLKQQFTALLAEYNNVGAGQYALSSLYLSALAESLPSAKRAGMSWPPGIADLLGEVIGQNLAVWAVWHQKLSGREMQTYTKGFLPGASDVAGLQ